MGSSGWGAFSRSHAAAIAELDNVEIVAVADLFADKRAEFMDKWGVAKGYTTHTELLQDPEVDAVAITLGHQLHHRLTVDACNAGKHVLVEKPMAISLDQCDAMIEAADANRRQVDGGPHPALLRHQPQGQGNSRLRDSSGPLMTVVCYMSKNWGFVQTRRPQYRSRYHGGGMWLANGVHVVDRLMWLLGSQAAAVSAVMGTRAHYQASDDTSTALIRTKNGLAGVAVACGYANGGPSFESHVIGANGSLKFSQHGEKFVRLGTGEQWEDVAFDDPKAEFYHEWEVIRESDRSGPGAAFGRHVGPPRDGDPVRRRTAPRSPAARWCWRAGWDLDHPAHRFSPVTYRPRLALSRPRQSEYTIAMNAETWSPMAVRRLRLGAAS